MTFWGFRGAVDRLGCVYTDVDRRYFNDNNPPNGGGGNYATIDIDAGYQKLCGQDALDYVRYRHFDNDLVRAARQQSFLGDAKSQIGVSGVFDDRKQLLKIFAQSVRTDIDGTGAILQPPQARRGVLEQARCRRSSSRRRTPATAPSQISEHRPAAHGRPLPGRQGLERPEGQDATSRRARRRRQAPSARARSSSARPGAAWSSNKNAGEDIGAQLQVKLRRLPVYYPRLMAAGGNYVVARRARLRRLRPHAAAATGAYRIVAYEGSIGQYYGIQGTDWKAPPILDDPSEIDAHARAHATSSSTTAAACGSSPGGPSAASTGCRTPSCGRSRTGRCSPWPGR